MGQAKGKRFMLRFILTLLTLVYVSAAGTRTRTWTRASSTRSVSTTVSPISSSSMTSSTTQSHSLSSVRSKSMTSSHSVKSFSASPSATRTLPSRTRPGSVTRTRTQTLPSMTQPRTLTAPPSASRSVTRSLSLSSRSHSVSSSQSLTKIPTRTPTSTLPSMTRLPTPTHTASRSTSSSRSLSPVPTRTITFTASLTSRTPSLQPTRSWTMTASSSFTATGSRLTASRSWTASSTDLGRTPTPVATSTRTQNEVVKTLTPTLNSHTATVKLDTPGTQTRTLEPQKPRTKTPSSLLPTGTQTIILPPPRTVTPTLIQTDVPTTAVPTTAVPLTPIPPTPPPKRTLTVQPYDDARLSELLSQLRSLESNFNATLVSQLADVPNPMLPICPSFLHNPETVITPKAITPLLTTFVRSSTDVIRLTWSESKTCFCDPALVAEAQVAANRTAGIVVMFDAVLNVSVVLPQCFQPIPTDVPPTTTTAPSLAPGVTEVPQTTDPNQTPAPSEINGTVAPTPIPTPPPTTETPSRAPPPTLPPGDVIRFSAVVPKSNFNIDNFRSGLAARLNTSVDNIQAVVEDDSSSTNVTVSFIFVGEERPLLQSMTNDLSASELGFLSLNAAAFTNPTAAPSTFDGLKRRSSLLWIGGIIALAFFALCFLVFHFVRERGRKKRQAQEAEDAASQPMLAMPQQAATSAEQDVANQL